MPKNQLNMRGKGDRNFELKSGKQKKLTKSELKKEYITKKLKTSYGGVSIVGMNSEGEEMIIRMLALLASKDRAVLGEENDHQSEGDDSSCCTGRSMDHSEDDESCNRNYNSDSDEDDYVIGSIREGGGDMNSDESDSDESDSEDVNSSVSGDEEHNNGNSKNNKKTATVSKENSNKKVSSSSPLNEEGPKISKHQFVRQLIRDDRRESREEKMQRELQRKANSPYLKAQAVGTPNAVEESVGKASRSNGKAVSSALRPPSKPLAVTVRLNIQADKTGGSKMLVVARTLSLSELLQLAKSKFTLSAKARAACTAFAYAASGERLHELDMLSIADGTVLRLCSGAAVGLGGGAGTVSHAQSTPAAKGTEASSSSSAHGKSKHKDQEQQSHAVHVAAAAPPAPAYWTPPSASVTSGYDTTLTTASIAPDAILSGRLRDQLHSLYSSPSYDAMRAHRESLPIFKARDELLYHINSNQVTVVSGETGSGKTTQLPLYIYEDMCERDRGAECYIVVTQPRRIAAITVAERVAYECNVKSCVSEGAATNSSVSGSGNGRNKSCVGDLVGYQIRLDSRCSKNTRILYCTTGVLLRKLQSPDFLHKVSHIILDEVHERQVETDFLMTLLKQQRPAVPALRIVLMSATMQEDLFTAYFERAPLVSVSGRTFPVTEHYLEDVHKLVAQGQRMTAAERGKMVAATTTADYGDPMGEGPGGRRGGRCGGKYAAEKREERQSNLLSIRAPRFDADTIAELVIRIITTHSKPVLVVGSTPTAAASSVIVDGTSSATVFRQPSAAPTGRMAMLQKAAGVPVTTSPTLPVTPDAPAPPANRASNDSASSPTVERGDAILVFLSGIQAIDRVNKAIRQRNVLGRLNAQMFTLHGSMPPEQQKKVFRTTLPGQWKIVLATNIAETSITVDDVTHVVDTGFVKEMRYDPVSNISSLQEVFVSRAAARQRSGRAGRVRAGHAWRVYSQEYFASDRVDEYSLPEIQRIPLEEVVLQVLLLKLGRPEQFLSQCLESPSLEQIKASVSCLLEVGAVLPLMEMPLTALGYHLAKMPVDVRLGKMLIYASLLQCVEPVLTIVAALGGKSPFFSPPELRGDANRAHNAFLLSSSNGGGSSGDSAKVNSYSDHIAIVAAYDAWLRVMRGQGNAAAYAFCREHFLSHNVLLDMQALREHFRHHLITAGFLPGGNRGRGGGGDDEVDEGEGEDEVFSCTAEDDLAVQLSAALTVNDSINRALDGHLKEGGVSSSVAAGAVAGAVNTSAAATTTVSAISSDLIKCILCAGLAPQLVRLRKIPSASRSGKSVKRFETGNETLQMMGADCTEVAVHPSSLFSRYTRDCLDNGDAGKRDAFVVYYKKVASTKVYLFDATVVPHVAVLLFGNGCHQLRIGTKRDRVTVGGWIEMKVEELHAVLYKRLQQEIECLLRIKVETPAMDIQDRERDLRFIVETLLSESSSNSGSGCGNHQRVK